MGCTASTLDTEQSVKRCKNRKHFIKLAVRHRHAFAAAHAAYIQSLKNTGAAIRQFGEGEAKDSTRRTADVASNAPNPLYYPPPLPHFLEPSSEGQPSPISRAVSMPPLRPSTLTNMRSAPNTALGKSPSPNSKVSPVRNSSLSPNGPLQEEEEEGEDNTESAQKGFVVADAKRPPPPPSVAPTPPPPPPPKGSAWEFLDVFPSATESDQLGNKVGNDKNEADFKSATLQDEAMVQHAELLQPYENPSTPSKDGLLESEEVSINPKASEKDLSIILVELDDHFLAAFESGKAVAKLLEARKTHYHSNFADFSDSLDHSLRVLRVMSWGRNPQLPLIDGDKVNLFEGKETETHASTLDKLLAWEKKLHDEVKAGELIRMELERKSVQLQNQKKREGNSLAVNKTKGLVKSLQTRYLVEIQAVDAASVEVDKLRDECLYNQLVELVKELMTMWNFMVECHKQQYQLIEDMASLDGSYVPSATNDFHLNNTAQLETEINLWHQNFDKLISTQKEYINAIYHWLRLHIIQIESDGKDTPGSPQKMSTPPLYHLCNVWLLKLDNLPCNVTLLALKALSSLIHELTMQQSDELKQKRKVEGLKKELEKKEINLRIQEAKYNERRPVAVQPSGSANSKEDGEQESGNPLRERERMVQSLRESLEMERARYELLCSKSGSMALNSLKKGLPPALNAIKDFAGTCAQYYRELHAITLAADTQTLQISYMSTSHGDGGEV